MQHMGTATLIQRICRDAPPPLGLRALCCLLQADERVLRSRTTQPLRRRTWLSQMWCDSYCSFEDSMVCTLLVHSNELSTTVVVAVQLRRST